jgi:3-hydroxymyristoyl/3-hydroxydecanoyl-(acyl carrier protein) dehydratase
LQRVELPIDPRHPAFAGHFPGEPVLPGVVLLDEALYVLSGSRALRWQILAAKFHHPVRPGDQPVLEYDAADGLVRFVLYVGQTAVASGAARGVATPAPRA